MLVLLMTSLWDARLVVWAPAERPPRLAYETAVGEWRVVVDAHTGTFLWGKHLVLRGRQALVFPGNPENSSLTTVTLDLPEGATTLTGDDVEVVNCIDEQSCPLQRGATRIRFCATRTIAVADGAGDFLYPRPSTDAAREDAFSEVQMYHHATRVMAYFRELGFAGLAERPLLAVVNLRLPDLSRATCTGPVSNLALQPYENAQFMTAGAIGRVFPARDAIVFGQGASVDYAYDGDVVAHELTHAVATTLSELGSVSADAFGLETSMAAMHEGFADYFAAVIGGDPRIGEYVARRVKGGPPALRDVDNQRRCPVDLDGEEHDDSEIFSGALWQARSRLAEADRPTFDRAVYTVLESLGAEESFDSVRAKLVAELTRVLGDAGAAATQQIFVERGLDGCGGRVQELPLGTPRPLLYMLGAEEFGLSTPLPGSLQLVVTLTRPARELRVTIDASISGADSASGRPRLALLCKPGGAPIVWNPDTLTHDAPLVAAVAVDDDQGGAGRGVLAGDFPPGVYHLQLTNGATTWWLANVRVSTDVEPAVEEGGGCAVAAGGSGGAWILVLLGLLTARAASPRRGPC